MERTARSSDYARPETHDVQSLINYTENTGSLARAETAYLGYLLPSDGGDDHLTLEQVPERAMQSLGQRMVKLAAFASRLVRKACFLIQ